MSETFSKDTSIKTAEHLVVEIRALSYIPKILQFFFLAI